MTAEGLHFPCQVTTMVTRRIVPGREAEYAEGLREVAQTARGFDGHQGVTVLGPHGGPPTEFTAIFTLLAPAVDLFVAETVASLAHAGAVLDGAKAGGKPVWLSVTVDDEDVESLTGLEPWFTLPNRVVNRPPARWKMAVLTTLGVYPMLLVLGVVLNPVVGDWPMALRLGASLVLGIPLMTWFIMPGLSRIFFSWLYPEPERGALTRGQS